MNKASVLVLFGTVCGFVTSLFGGWDAGMATLIVCMAIDYITGIVVAAVFHRSPKSEGGSLESKAGFKGLLKKGMVLIMVLVAVRLDLVLGTGFIRDAVIIAYIANEVLSIIENAGLMGVPIPSAITKAIEVLKNRSETEGEKLNEHTDDSGEG